MRTSRLAKFKLSRLFVLMILIFSLSYTMILSSTGSRSVQTDSGKKLSSLINIYITSDSGFIDYGFPGNGSSQNPYLIQDLSFNNVSPNGYSIFIKNTAKYFAISNNTIVANNDGIYLENIISGTAIIEANIFKNLVYYKNTGLQIRYSDEIIIENNTFEKFDSAIYLRYSDGSLIQNNNFTSCNYCVGGSYLAEIKFKSNTLYACDQGISISRCPNSIISNNIITMQGYLGTSTNDVAVSVSRGDYSEISSNYIYERIKEGILCSESQYCFIYNNTIIRTEVGIKIEYYSHYATVLENFCSRSIVYNLHIENSDYVTTSKNNFSESSCDGIFVNFVSKALISGNDIISSGINGIYLRKSSEIYIGQNYITKSTFNGVYSTNSSDSVISYNYFFENTEYGVYLDQYSYFNRIHHNEFVYNNLDGFSQALDDGEHNKWFDSNLEEGNFWTDFSGKNGYEIDGSANSIDIYAFKSANTTTNDVTFLNNTLWISLLLLVFFIRRKNRFNVRLELGLIS
ncbi:MAG: right-handed parallel beta-helix repeat-containing protein [Candidatus Heimdallarchaeota archaeon]|nr:right-handed parallel beta-helix repeat-containing protein [Candidatus Heimdallarchaeota archaeon]MCK4611435.1 right-handed parallel beta-helix repeat-containing protein [Candidatus Heimdallarchaeota archaeon]